MPSGKERARGAMTVGQTDGRTYAIGISDGIFLYNSLGNINIIDIHMSQSFLDAGELHHKTDELLTHLLPFFQNTLFLKSPLCALNNYRPIYIQ